MLVHPRTHQTRVSDLTPWINLLFQSYKSSTLNNSVHVDPFRPEVPAGTWATWISFPKLELLHVYDTMMFTAPSAMNKDNYILLAISKAHPSLHLRGLETADMTGAIGS